MAIQLQPDLYWRFRAACADLDAHQLRARAETARLQAAKAAALDLIVEAVPTFDRTANFTSDDATCTLMPIAQETPYAPLFRGADRHGQLRSADERRLGGEQHVAG
jgi:hypothetical protein